VATALSEAGQVQLRGLHQPGPTRTGRVVDTQYYEVWRKPIRTDEKEQKQFT
jgi:hypothetical protein